MDQRTNQPKYDLEERTLLFSKSVILFCKSLKQDLIIRPLISQLVRSSTSVGANYMEANGASSKKDFSHKISICNKEAKETLYWLALIAESFEEYADAVRPLYRECKEIVLIFSKISKTTRAQI